MATPRSYVGRSAATPAKQEILRSIMRAHADIMRNLSKGQPWRSVRDLAVDLTAGDGGTDEEPGSPVIMAEAAATLPFPVDLWLCDRNPSSMALLTERMASVASANCDMHFLLGDHAKRISEIVAFTQACPASWYGLVYFDANGGPLPASVINCLITAPGLHRIDLLAHLNSVSGYKRIRAVGKSDRRLPLDLAAIDKKTTLISPPIGHDRWTFTSSTNHDKPPRFGRDDVLDILSPKGQERLDRLDLSKGERQRRDQMSLPLAGAAAPGLSERPYRTYAEYLAHPRFREIRAEVMQRAGGCGETCHAAPAREVHHLRYPPWGTFDVPENLIAICRPCHRAIHERENHR
jgi:hypothetical protein